MNRKCLLVYVSAFILFASCRHNSTYGLIRELPDGKFPVISNSSENKFLGYKSYASGDPKDEKWVSRVFVYEKYIVNEIAWAYDIAGYVFYENDRKIHKEYTFLTLEWK
jgi:hypothetical protein